jgi:hypothetical protein
MKQTIFYLEGRGGMYLYHFFVLNLGGLFYIMNKKYNIRVLDGAVLLNDKSKIVSEPTTEITFPIKIYMKDVLPFQREAFEIIRDNFELIEDLSTISDYEIVSIYGETCDRDPVGDNQKYIFPYLRNLFTKRCNYQMIPGKRIFITRKNSESQHNGTLKRCILNENVLMVMLRKYNFDFIQLEEYKTNEKIKLFMESEIILSTHGSQLTFTLFTDKNAKVIEILNQGARGFAHDHIIGNCNTLNLNYNRYSHINEDTNGNFNINVDDFEKYLLTLL